MQVLATPPPPSTPPKPLTMFCAPQMSASHTRLPTLVSWLRPMALLAAPTSGVASSPTTRLASTASGSRYAATLAAVAASSAAHEDGKRGG